MLGALLPAPSRQLAEFPSAGAETPPPEAYTLNVRDRQLQLFDAHGNLRIDFTPTLRVRHREARGPRRLPGPVLPEERIQFERFETQTHEGGGWKVYAHAETPRARYEWELAREPQGLHPTGDQLRMRIRVTYRRPVLVMAEILELTTAPATRAQWLDRAYRYQELTHESVVSDSLTPHVARFDGEWSVYGGRQLQALGLHPQPNGSVRLDFELDRAENHPFVVKNTCGPSLTNGDPKPLPPRLALDETFRDEGATHASEATFTFGVANLPLPSRFPRGFQAAAVFTDHADQSNLEKFEAFAFGETGKRDAGGWVDQGLGYTKTIFLKKARGFAPQFDDPHYRQRLEALRGTGVEIGLHTASGLTDTTPDAAMLLAEFRAAGFGGATWIDHSPHTNCDSISNRGWDPLSPWYMVEQLQRQNFRYLWSVQDLALPTGSLNLLAPELRHQRRPTIYDHLRLGSGDHPFTFFASSWFFDSQSSFVHHMSDGYLDRLVAEHGLLMAHVYFDTHRKQGVYRDNTHLRQLAPRHFRLRPESAEVIARFHARQAQGEIWFAGIEALHRHVDAALSVQFAWRGGAVHITNPTAVDLPGLTLWVAADPDAATPTLTIDGQPPLGQKRVGQSHLVWFDLPAGATRRLESSAFKFGPAREIRLNRSGP